MRSIIRRIGAAVAALAIVAAAAVPTALEAEEKVPPGASAPAPTVRQWDKDTVRLFGSLPVQDGGRVKPLSTLAGFRLLKANGKRKYMRGDERLTPTHWLLDCLFYPEVAKRQAFFFVQNDEVLTAIGLPNLATKKSDRYAYQDIFPARNKLLSKWQEYGRVEAKDRTPVQRQTLRLGQTLLEFEQLMSSLDFARVRYPVDGSDGMAQLFEGIEEPRLADVLERASQIRHLSGGNHEGHDHAAPTTADGHAVSALFRALQDGIAGSGVISILPPSASVDEEPKWLSPAEVTHAAFDPNAEITTQIALLRVLDAMVVNRADPAGFRQQTEKLHADIKMLAEKRGEYSKVSLEVAYYRGDYFYYSLILFAFGFIGVALSWMWPRNVWLARVATAPVVIALVLVTIGITLRCLIRGRPPVSTLYETIVFITGTGVAASLVAEWINRQRIALGVAAFLGALGMFLAGRYEAHEAVDTMPSLAAVLDTNFWLATHVTTVVIGYAAGLFASAVAHVYLLGRLFGIKRGDSQFYKGVTRMTYGLLAFSLVFSVIGTILGGVWANDSWGRFWGWDPKENGALMIVLWELAVLHARLGGYIRDHGIALSAVFCGAIVAFSWWGVNLLGVGLHTYGFTSGAAYGLMIFCAIESVVLLAGGIQGLMMRSAAPTSGSTPPVPPVPPSIPVTPSTPTAT